MPVSVHQKLCDTSKIGVLSVVPFGNIATIDVNRKFDLVNSLFPNEDNIDDITMGQ
jgi:hypothetical protein